jgi:hypothetical protein
MTSTARSASLTLSRHAAMCSMNLASPTRLRRSVVASARERPGARRRRIRICNRSSADTTLATKSRTPELACPLAATTEGPSCRRKGTRASQVAKQPHPSPPHSNSC